MLVNARGNLNTRIDVHPFTNTGVRISQQTVL